jgi:hypothetical protein
VVFATLVIVKLLFEESRNTLLFAPEVPSPSSNIIVWSKNGSAAVMVTAKAFGVS